MSCIFFLCSSFQPIFVIILTAHAWRQPYTLRSSLSSGTFGLTRRLKFMTLSSRYWKCLKTPQWPGVSMWDLSLKCMACQTHSHCWKDLFGLKGKELCQCRVTVLHERKLRAKAARNYKLEFLNVQTIGLSGRSHPALHFLVTLETTCALHTLPMIEDLTQHVVFALPY